MIWFWESKEREVVELIGEETKEPVMVFGVLQEGSDTIKRRKIEGCRDKWENIHWKFLLILCLNIHECWLDVYNNNKNVAIENSSV